MRRTVMRPAAGLIAVAAWFLLLAPTSLGGSTSYIRVSGHSMDGTYDDGDLVIQRRKASYQVGDIVAFRVSGGQVIHRIVGGNGVEGYIMRGDNKPDTDPWRPRTADVIGSTWLRIPQGGRGMDVLASPLIFGTLAGIASFFLVSSDGDRSRRARRSLRTSTATSA